VTLTRTRPSAAAAATRARGEAILVQLGIEPSREPRVLATAVVPSEVVPFRADLGSGLETLFEAVARRLPALAEAAAARLVGLGPGRTPLGDDYLAGCGLAVARLGSLTWFASPQRERWLSALLPPRLVESTTPISAYLIARAVRGVAEPEIAGLLRLRGAEAALGAAVTRISAIGATSGRAWAASIGATAILLGAGPEDPDGGERAE
jgi:hypothetical protein